MSSHAVVLEMGLFCNTSLGALKAQTNAEAYCFTHLGFRSADGKYNKSKMKAMFSEHSDFCSFYFTVCQSKRTNGNEYAFC